jgi:hypothetical protein
MSHVRELHRRSMAFIQVLCRAVGLEGFCSDFGTSGIAPGSLFAGFGTGGLGTGGSYRLCGMGSGSLTLVV